MANLDDFLNVDQPPQEPAKPAPQAQQQGIDPLEVEERAKMRAEMEEMRAELARFRSGAIQPVQQAPQEDPWQAHIRAAMREASIGANDFVENPMETFVRASAITMKKARELWNQDVVSLNSSMRLDSKFEDRYPDLYASDNKKKLVGIALQDLRGDINFNRLLGATETIPQALDMLAKNTYKMLGIPNPHEEGATTNQPVPPIAQRKGTYGMPGGSRMQGERPREDVQVNEVGNMVRYMQGKGPGVGS